MSVQAMAWVFDHSEADLGTRLVALAVANHADKYGRDAWASVATYAAEAHLSERQTQYALRALERSGELRRTGRRGPRADRLTYVYEFPGLVDGVQDSHLVNPDGVQSTTERGAESGMNGVQPIAPEPSLNHPEPSKELEALDHVGAGFSFEAFWTAYPRKVGKPKARTAYMAAIRRADPQVILAGVLRYANDPNRDDSFTAHPTTWLNRDGWDDPPLPSRTVRSRRAGLQTADLLQRAVAAMGEGR